MNTRSSVSLLNIDRSAKFLCCRALREKFANCPRNAPVGGQLNIDQNNFAKRCDRSEFGTRLPFSSTKSCTDPHCNTSVHSTVSPTCLAADLSVLLAPTVCQCRRWSWQPSPTNRAFPVVDPRTWNDLGLPDDVTSAESLSTFRHRLKTHLFAKSFFSDYSLDWTSPNLSPCSGPSSSLYHLGHYY